MNEPQDQTGLYKRISTLGDVIGIGVAILVTPALFEATKRPLFVYLAKTLGRDLAEILTLGAGGIEAYLIYALSSMAFTGGMLWLIARIAMRRFRG